MKASWWFIAVLGASIAILFGCSTAPKTLRPQDLLISPTADLDHASEQLTAEQASDDIALLLYALVRGYGGRDFLPHDAFQDAIHRLQAIKGPISRNSLKNYGGPSDGIDWFFEAVLRRRDSAPLKIPSSSIRSNPNLKATRVYISLCDLQMVGAALVGYSDDEVVRSFKVKINGWHDNAVTGASAYADYFIVDDNDARNRAQFLTQRGLATFQPMTLSEFLSTA